MHQAILDDTEMIFLRDGYLGTSMDEVAARSHLSRQTFYKHGALIRRPPGPGAFPSARRAE
ncbi:MAG: TetR/AcrR family transcriptional regulator [Acidimicrobiales bacterium]